MNEDGNSVKIDLGAELDLQIRFEITLTGEHEPLSETDKNNLLAAIIQGAGQLLPTHQKRWVQEFGMAVTNQLQGMSATALIVDIVDMSDYSVKEEEEEEPFSFSNEESPAPLKLQA
jgi:hypothetical protein